MLDNVTEYIELTNETIEMRKQKVLTNMKRDGLSSLIIYADKEHGSNFEYLTGFIPRFEEALQILNVDGTSVLVLGNENFNKTKFSRVISDGIKASVFSLPNQPIHPLSELTELLKEAHIDASGKVGIVGWKIIPQMAHDYDVPAFIVRAIQNVVEEQKLINATYIYIDAATGARITNNANEIAHYEYGASLASDSVLSAMNALEVGVTEQEVGNYLQSNGMFPNVVTITAFGNRFVNANIYPTNKQLQNGDKVALTVSYRGGLSSRSGYAVTDLIQIEQIDSGYYEEVMLPYFSAYVYWLEHIKIGMTGGAFFKAFHDIYPQSTYGWELNPGHLVANEEWMCSPLYEESDALIQSGMIFQVDFIPIQAGHNGVSAESTVALADKELREDIQKKYPEMWNRIVQRKSYMKDVLGIQLSDELLPLTSTLAYYRPFLLDKEVALVKESK